jgi:hypothetical protein
VLSILFLEIIQMAFPEESLMEDIVLQLEMDGKRPQVKRSIMLKEKTD